MTPYFQDAGGRVAIYHGDCREVLPQLAVAADAVIADPPYGDTSLVWDVPVRDWLAAAGPLVSPSGSVWCFGSLRMLLDGWRDFEGWNLAQDVVWEKHNGSSFHADRFKRVHEHAVLWRDVYKSPVTTQDAAPRQVRRKRGPTHTGQIAEGHYISDDGGPRLMRSVIAVRSCHGEAVHPTQKPCGIVAPLVEYSCPPGGLVLDPMTAGGGLSASTSTSAGARRPRGGWCRSSSSARLSKRLVSDMGPKPPKPQLCCAKCYQPLISGVVLIDWLAFVTRRKPGPVDVVFYEGRYFHRRCCAQQVLF